MTEHLPECPMLKPCCDDEQFPEHGFCGNFVGGPCLHCMAECICDALRACEQRIAKKWESFARDQFDAGYAAAMEDGWGEPGHIKAALDEAAQRVEALPHALECVTRDPNYKRPCNCLHGDALDAIKGDQP